MSGKTIHLLDADNENVTVIRIDRVDNVNKMNILKGEDIRTLWGNPLLRYSNILSGLFHEKVIVCESDYHVLESYNLATESKLEDARKFVQALVDYKPDSQVG